MVNEKAKPSEQIQMYDHHFATLTIILDSKTLGGLVERFESFTIDDTTFLLWLESAALMSLHSCANHDSKLTSSLLC